MIFGQSRRQKRRISRILTCPGDRMERENFLLTFDADQSSVISRTIFRVELGSRRWKMPSSAVCTFTDPVEYFTGIRNLQIVGIVQRRGEFRAESTRIDLHRLWMHRFDEDLPRLMKVTPSGMRAVVIFATHTHQPAMQVNGIEISQNQGVKFGLDWEWYLRSSAACEWSTMSLAPRDLAAAGESIIGRELVPPTFARSIAPQAAALSRLRKVYDGAGHLAKTAPDILAKPEVARAIERALVEAMVFCLAD